MWKNVWKIPSSKFFTQRIYSSGLSETYLQSCQESMMDHCIKSVHIQSYSGPNVGKYGPE